MNAQGHSILSHLESVVEQRRLRAADPALRHRVHEVKQFQQARFRHSYADLLSQPRYSRAARFFLEELYGPGDFAHRDGQFARVVPGLVRLFPREIVGTVAELGELHALSEALDTAMGQALVSPKLDATGYCDAWRAVGRASDRERQITLMLGVGSDLDRYTHRAMLRHSLRLMRGPASAAGLGALQRFLESGFDTFREMRGAEYFLNTIAQRERALADLLFASDPVSARAALPPEASAA